MITEINPSPTPERAGLPAPAPSPAAPAPLFPPALLRPVWLYWLWVLPQGLLLAVNFAHWRIVAGDLDEDQQVRAAVWGLAELANLGVGLGLALALRKFGRTIGWRVALAAIVTQMAYLWYTATSTGQLLPSGLGAWIVTPDAIVFDQWTFAMPTAFFGALVLASRPLPLRRGQDLGLTLATALGIPLGAYLLLFGLNVIDKISHYYLPTILPLLLVGTTVLLGLSVLRFLLLIGNGVAARHRMGKTASAAVVALLMPLGGLWLNSSIPFPANFQSPWVYGLTLVNALVLLWPDARQRGGNTLLFLARCATLPFTVYFFLVFLPFLPLTIPAMFAAGAGFLILTPTLLFVVHLQRLRDGYQAGLSLGGWPLILSAAVAVGYLPGALVVETYTARAQLNHALDYVFSPDPARPRTFDGNAANVANTILWLRDYENGQFYPYLTPLRNQILFDNMVLPDEKMQRLYQTFSGQPLSLEHARDDFGGAFLGMHEGSVHAQNTRTRTRSFPHQVAVVNRRAVLHAPESDGSQRARLELTVRGQELEDEYVTVLSPPPGAVVTGLWLYIGDEKVPGRIFERRAALWVYEQIRDVQRRDPALLVYRDDGRLALRVFPVAQNVERRVEIEFLLPPGAPATVQQDGTAVSFVPVESPASTEIADPQPSLATSSFGTWATFPAPWLARQATVTRTPEPIVLVDHSLSGVDTPSLRRALAAIQNTLPEATGARVWLANYNALLLTPGERMTPWANLTTLGQNVPPAQGGFLPGPLAAGECLNFDQTESTEADKKTVVQHYPLFIVVSDDESAAPEVVAALQPWRHLFPDSPGVIQVHTTGRLQLLRFDGRMQVLDPHTHDLPKIPVILTKLEGQVRAVLPSPAGATTQVETAAAAVPGSQFAVLKENAFRNETVSHLPPNSTYARAAAVEMESQALAANPSLGRDELRQLVERSATQGVLAPQTAYIVLERSSQWEALKQKEKNALNGRLDLALTETPEPAAWMLAGGWLLYEAARRRLGRHRC